MKAEFIKPQLIPVISVLCIFATTPLHADGTNTIVQPKVSGHHAQADISKWDLNKDGRLDADELEAYQRDMHQQRVQRLEAQRRAQASLRREQLARQGIPRLVPKEVLTQYDLNKNGILDPYEWAQYRADQAAKHGKTYTPANPYGPDARIVVPPAKPMGK